MDIKYRAFMKEYKLTFESEVLDPAFVEKAKDFEKKLSRHELSDEEAAVIDDELMGMLAELEVTEVDSKEVKAANLRAEIAEAKNQVSEATSIDELKELQEKFAHLPGLDKFIAVRIERSEKELNDKNAKKFQEEALQEIEQAAYADLSALAEKYKEHAGLLKKINGRIKDENPAKGQETPREKLAAAKKREFSYDELRAMGIEPTGDDINVEGVILERQYMFKVYRIVSIDGKRV
jgi:hypothetical protein